MTHRPFYTQTLLHTDPATHKPPSHKHVGTQTLLHTNACTHKRFYKRFYTPTLHTQTLLHTDALHTNALTQKRFDTQTLWHKNAFTQERFYTQTLSKNYQWHQFLTLEPHVVRKGCRRGCKLQKTISFWRTNLISCERVAAEDVKPQKTVSFSRANLISCERGVHTNQDETLPCVCARAWMHYTDPFFPIASESESDWVKGSSKRGGRIFTNSHLHIFHLNIFTSLHLHIFLALHTHIFTSLHLLSFTSSHLHIAMPSLTLDVKKLLPRKNTIPHLSGDFSRRQLKSIYNYFLLMNLWYL